ncbi:hypothetical protein BC829DRAFT_404290 [Chytridium lagenaria]|nr:hypothetical protein BC829DRAFT_404290 [Chytridium lagenaria]
MSNSPNEAVSNLTATVGDDLEWLLKISIPVFLGVNSMSLVLSVLAMSFFLLGRIKNQKLFDRASLQIVLGLVIANTVFHTSYIISLYIQENVACKLTMFGYLFGSLFGCFLISALAYTPWLLFLTAVLVALGFSVAFIVISPVYYNELYGCWFVDDSQTVSWVCYYGPLFVISILNLAMALAIYLRLKNHERSMDDRKSILSSIFGVFSENVVPFICDAPVGGKQSVRRSVISDGSATNNDEAGEQEGDDDHNDSLV